MKSIIISVKPEELVQILNKEKNIKICKSIPKGKLPIKVYLCCTKGRKLYDLKNCGVENLEEDIKMDKGKRFCLGNHKVKSKKDIQSTYMNNKVVGEFVLDNVDRFEIHNRKIKTFGEIEDEEKIEKEITNLPFVSKLYYTFKHYGFVLYVDNLRVYEKQIPINKQPRNWCYVERN